MKKTLLSFLTSISIVTTAQTITQASHFPIAGNTYSLVQCDSVGITGGSVSGAAATWNYASLVVHTSTSKTNYVVAVTSNTTYPSASISVGTATNNVSYYSTDGAKQYYWGGNVNVKNPIGGTVDLNLQYTAPAVHMAYPAILTTTTSVVASGNSSLGSFTCSSNTNVDGTGSLILPAKTFTDVIRVKTIETFTFGTGFTQILLNRTKFDYYSTSATQYALLTIDSSFVSSTFGSDQQKFVTLIQNYNDVSVVENSKNTIQLSVFPNPATNLINFTATSPEATKLIAYDITGKIIGTELMESGKTKMNTTNLASGVYMYHVLGKYNQVLKSGKFNVSK